MGFTLIDSRSHPRSSITSYKIPVLSLSLFFLSRCTLCMLVMINESSSFQNASQESRTFTRSLLLKFLDHDIAYQPMEEVRRNFVQMNEKLRGEGDRERLDPSELFKPNQQQSIGVSTKQRRVAIAAKYIPQRLSSLAYHEQTEQQIQMQGNFFTSGQETEQFILPVNHQIHQESPIRHETPLIPHVSALNRFATVTMQLAMKRISST